MRVNFRDVQDRFQHIDATCVRTSIVLGDGDESRLVVSLYPWWEHPKFLDAVAKNQPWGFSGFVEKEVTVIPINVRQCMMSTSREMTDWEWTESHPALWAYEEQGQVFVNTSYDHEKMILAVKARVDPPTSWEALTRYLPPVREYAPPFSLGRFPYSLYGPVVDALAEQGAGYFTPSKPKPRETPVALVIDGVDVLVADDFELDVPDFEHLDEWFTPKSG